MLRRVVATRAAAAASILIFIAEFPNGLYNDGFNKGVMFKLATFLSYITAIHYGFNIVNRYKTTGKLLFKTPSFHWNRVR